MAFPGERDKLATPGEIRAAVLEYFAANPVERPDYERIISAVLQRVRVPEIDYTRILSDIGPLIPARPADGVSVTGARIAGPELVLTLSNGRELNAGRVVSPSAPGANGTGIQGIEQIKDEIVITLTNGRVQRFKIPERRVVAGWFGGGQEVFLGAPTPLPNYPAIIFEPITVDGQATYKMRFNDGLA